MMDNDYLTETTRAIVTVFNLYNPVTKYFTSVNMLVEQSASGFTNGSRLIVGPFMLDLISRGGTDAAIEIFRIILSGIFFLKIIMVFLKKSSIETCLTMQTFAEIAFDLIILFL
mmetsp:Transcript_83372/g.115074  ORF Transcript_83372/g.115074 Transcript_83372/m.115074 type:complete len:114 (+) Transcript_83372:453-794(+)